MTTKIAVIGIFLVTQMFIIYKNTDPAVNSNNRKKVILLMASLVSGILTLLMIFLK